MRVDADEAREIADVLLELYGRISGPDGPRRHRVAHDASRPHERVLADLDARQDRAVSADAGATTDHAALHAIEIGGALRMRLVREDHVWAKEHVVVDLRELQAAPGVHPPSPAAPVAEFDRRARPDRHDVA